MRLFPPLDIWMRVCLAPVLVWQGMSIRRNALILPEAQGPRSGEIGNGPSLRLLILGDSSGAGVGVASQQQALSGQLTTALAADHCVSWKVIARTGATTREATAMLSQAEGETYDVALLALGVNDAVRLVRLGKWRKQQRALRQKLRLDFGVQQIVVTEMPPLGRFPALTPLLRWILGAHALRMRQGMIADVATEEDVVLLTIDIPFSEDQMASDGYHPNAASYAIWGKAAAGVIKA